MLEGCPDKSRARASPMRTKVDFGDQHQCLLARLQGLADQLQIHFGLAAAGQYVEHAIRQARLGEDLGQLEG